MSDAPAEAPSVGPAGSIAVEAWAPSFTASVGDDGLPPSPGDVDVTVEQPADAWRPLAPAVSPAACVRFVDGVQRVDAQLWHTQPGGAVLPGLAVSIAAGAVRCDRAATIEAVEVRRLALGPPDVAPIEARRVAYAPRPVVAPDDRRLAEALSSELRQLENAIARRLHHDPDALLVLDGPLNGRLDVAGAVGYVKTHHVAYLEDRPAAVLRSLAPGERTPIFLVTTRFSRWSWYLRLPRGSVPRSSDHAMSGIVRCEAPTTLSREEVVALADRASATLPRYASSAHREARAPQNLTPIAGLEARLKHRLGDRHLLERQLRGAVATSTAPQETDRAAASTVAVTTTGRSGGTSTRSA